MGFDNKFSHPTSENFPQPLPNPPRFLVKLMFENGSLSLHCNAVICMSAGLAGDSSNLTYPGPIRLSFISSIHMNWDQDFLNIFISISFLTAGSKDRTMDNFKQQQKYVKRIIYNLRLVF